MLASIHSMASPASTESPPPVRPSQRRLVPIDPAGIPFVTIPLAVALALALAGAPWRWFGVPIALLGLFSLFFFRDPDRSVAGDPSLVLSPADGRVMAVADDANGVVVTIFLSILDVHVNRIPVAGRVVSVTHRPGRFLAAFRPEATAVNERTDLVLDTRRGRVMVAQIAGLIARRIVVRVRPGDRLAAGERYGLIRFGSCTQLSLPAGVTPLVRPGDRVRGGLSVVARWHETGADR